MPAKPALRIVPCLPPNRSRRRGTCPDSDDVTAVFQAAARVEPDPFAVMAWYRATPIVELDGLTPRSLVARGRGGEVLAFLREIAERRRG